MIKKAIRKTQQPLVLTLSIIGAVIGLSLLLLVTQLYNDMQYIQTNSSGAIGEQYLVVKKQISLKNTLGIASTEINETELTDLANQPFVKDLAPFTSGQDFMIYAVIALENAKNDMSTLGFIESLPDKFIDVDTKDWSWKENDEWVPIILPTTFLDAYNFGLAATVGAPVISKELIGGIKIEMHISGNGQKQLFKARVIDFSDRINSSLVPESFLTYANAKFGTGIPKNPTKVIIATTNIKDPKIEQYLADHSLETNKEQLRGTLIEKLIQPILWFAGSLCIIIIVMTILLFLLYAEVLVIKSSYEIKLLSLLGYPWKAIATVFTVFFLKVYVVIAVFSMLLFAAAKYITNGIIEDNLLIKDLPFFSIPTLLVGLLFIACFVFFNDISIRKQIKNLAKPR